MPLPHHQPPPSSPAPPSRRSSSPAPSGACAVALGRGAHSSVLPRLATFYITLGDLRAARAAVQRAAGKARAFPWNLLIWGYAARGLWEDVILACKEMLTLGVVADRFTYPSVPPFSETAVGREIEQRIRERRYGLDMFVWNALLGMYARCGELEEARSWRRRAGCSMECLRGILSAGTPW
jgi:pentatricopeptide repeat protein